MFSKVSSFNLSAEGWCISQPSDQHQPQGLPEPGPLDQDGGPEGEPSCDTSRPVIAATLQSSGTNIPLIFSEENVTKTYIYSFKQIILFISKV